MSVMALILRLSTLVLWRVVCLAAAGEGGTKSSKHTYSPRATFLLAEEGSGIPQLGVVVAGDVDLLGDKRSHRDRRWYLLSLRLWQPLECRW